MYVICLGGKNIKKKEEKCKNFWEWEMVNIGYGWLLNNFLAKKKNKYLYLIKVKNIRI